MTANPLTVAPALWAEPALDLVLTKPLGRVDLEALLALLALQLGWATPSALAAPSNYPTVHIVQWGENLFRIAMHYGTTVGAIASANGIVNPNRIYAGQRLVIPYGYHPHPHPYPHPHPNPPLSKHPSQRPRSPAHRRRSRSPS